MGCCSSDSDDMDRFMLFFIFIYLFILEWNCAWRIGDENLDLRRPSLSLSFIFYFGVIHTNQAKSKPESRGKVSRSPMRGNLGNKKSRLETVLLLWSHNQIGGELSKWGF